jgi:epoxyqueuosine reductase QueG
LLNVVKDQTLNAEIESAELKAFCLSTGADLVGIADLGLLKERFPAHPPDLLDNFSRGISIGIVLDREIIEGISDGPTAAYAFHYREVNRALDELAQRVVEWIEGRGCMALSVPASDVVDEDDWRGAVSHRAVGRLAGLGWSGKSLMLINPRYGPRFRMATILTDMPIEPEGSLENRCGACCLCVDACVAGAVKNVGTISYYEDRSVAVDLDRCVAVLKGFKARMEIGAMVCGVCVKVCPYGQISRK